MKKSKKIGLGLILFSAISFFLVATGYVTVIKFGNLEAGEAVFRLPLTGLVTLLIVFTSLVTGTYFMIRNEPDASGIQYYIGIIPLVICFILLACIKVIAKNLSAVN